MKNKKYFSLLVSFLCCAGCLGELSSSVAHAELTLNLEVEAGQYVNVNQESGIRTCYKLNEKDHTAILIHGKCTNPESYIEWKLPTNVAINILGNEKEPAKTIKYDVIGVGENAFVRSKRFRINFSEAYKIKSIGNHAFDGCLKNEYVFDLRGLKSLEYIGEGAFSNNAGTDQNGGMNEIYIEDLPNLEYICRFAFSNDRVRIVHMKNLPNIKKVGGWVFDSVDVNENIAELTVYTDYGIYQTFDKDALLRHEKVTTIYTKQ